MVNRNLASMVFFCTFALAGCLPDGQSVSSSSSEPSQLGLNLGISDSPEASEYVPDVLLDVVVPVFDPNIPDDPDEYEELGIWPEVRRTEAIRFAGLMKKELQATKAFGDVRVVPHTAVTSDLYVIGQVKKSNGEDVAFEISVFDITQKRWMKRDYEHRVKEYHWQSKRKSSSDPYQPAFKKAAKDIVNLLQKKSSDNLEQLRLISDLQFASAFAPEALGEYLDIKDKKLVLVSVPAEDDPMLSRTRALRVADQLYMDRMQTHYDDFVQSTDSSYVAWQEHSMSSAKSAREAKKKSTSQAIIGGLLLLGAAVAASNASDDGGYDAGAALGATVAATGGIVMLQKSFESSAEGKFHRENLIELGRDLDFDIAPQIVQLESETVTLQGDVREQYLQWQALLRRMYELERVPDVQL